MSIPYSLQRAASNMLEQQAVLQDTPALPTGNKPQLRRFDVMSLLPNGDIAETRHIAPAMPLFENAFTAFSRGSMVETDHGPVAIEDLFPGDNILTTDGETMPLMWKGSTLVLPTREAAKGTDNQLTSLMPDSMGYHKPASCVVVGASARLLCTPAHLRKDIVGGPLLTPVPMFHDGMNIVETAPPTPVQMFHLMLPQHAVIRIAGLEFETFHPGTDALRHVSHAMRTLFLNLFSHIDTPTDFGPLAHPRAEGKDRGVDREPFHV
ncbi:Hint domain-containing protein [Epibacterium ulvae]|uniref:Hint domain-containing protein n=1 Tax=Epibacterium ulvae TaxID=1156985 RepID=UPI00249398DF|nr:Hint domain-containing protein [Epibacterium ulvae]